MNCRQVNHLLSAYIDGELPGHDYRAVATHIAHCSECHSEYCSLVQTKRLLTALRMKQPEGDLAAAVIANVHASGFKHKSTSTWSSRGMMFSNVLQAGFLGAGVLFLASVIYSQSNMQQRGVSIQWHSAAVTSQDRLPVSPLSLGRSFSRVNFPGFGPQQQSVSFTFVNPSGGSSLTRFPSFQDHASAQGRSSQLSH